MEFLKTKKNCFKKQSRKCILNITSSHTLSCLSADKPVCKTSQCSVKDSSEGHVNMHNHVYIKRDYRVGTQVKFRLKCPKKLQTMINDDALMYTVRTLNKYYADADQMDCTSCCLGCLSWFTSYLVYVCIDTHYERCIRKAVNFINEQNEIVYLPRRLLLTDPIENGLRYLKITILDYEIKTVNGKKISSSESSGRYGA